MQSSSGGAGAAHHSAVVSHPTSRPSYGVSATAGPGSYDDEDYDDDDGEDWELGEELAKLDGYYECEWYLHPFAEEARKCVAFRSGQRSLTTMYASCPFPSLCPIPMKLWSVAE